MAKEKRGVIIAGRQHSGNSVLCKIFGRANTCLVDCGESTWFEHANEVRSAPNSREAVQRAFDCLPSTFSSRADLQDDLDGIPTCGTEPSTDDVYRLYGNLLDAVATARGRSHWVVKATSFIFYAPQVLEQIPSLRMVYLIRNPLDLVASNYKRVRRTIEAGDDLLYGDWLYTPILGWKRGLNRALSVRERVPDRVRLIRYEDMVQDDGVVRDLFDFVEVPFDRSYLHVSHVNQSDHPTPGTDQKTARKGLNASRVGYNSDVLNASQLHAARSLLSEDELEQWYPELLASQNGSGNWWEVQKCRLKCGGRLAQRLYRNAVNAPRHTVQRVWRRVFG